MSDDDDLDVTENIPLINVVSSDETCNQLLEGKDNNLKNKGVRRKILKCLEEKNRNDFVDTKTDNKLYPNIIDPNFTLKLTQKKEFLDNKLYSKNHLIPNLEEEADKLCNPIFEFELEPHQMFIKNFMSFQNTI